MVKNTATLQSSSTFALTELQNRITFLHTHRTQPDQRGVQRRNHQSCLTRILTAVLCFLPFTILTGISASAQTVVVLNTITCSSAYVAAPGTDNCTVSMNAPAPAGGLGINITSSSTALTVPTWVVVPANVISAGFTAKVPSAAAAQTVTLTAKFNGLSKTVALQVNSTAPAPTVGVSVSPTSASISVKSTKQFTASVTGTSNTAVTWTVAGSGCSGTSCGTISSSGLYTAPSLVPSPATVTITARSQQDSTKSALASVAIASSTVATGTTYYLAPASAGGNDSNNGLSASAPWRTPNHSVKCGDLISAAPGSYDAADFTVNNWGTVSCPAGNSVAWLACAKFDSCRISTSSMSSGMWIDRSYWGVQGWEVTTQSGGTDPACFQIAPNFNNPVEIHHIIIANNVANGCQAGGISSVNHFGRAIGVDYLAVVGNIAYNSTQGSSECYTGISVFAPIASDSLPGTHIYLAGNFSWDNFDPSYCAGGPATDGEGLMFDELDASNQNLTPYAAQVVADNNILLANGGAGLQVDHNNAGNGPWATVYSRHNTMWGNNHDMNLTGWGHAELLIGEVNNTQSFYDLAVTNLAMGGANHPVYGFYVLDSPTTTNQMYLDWGYSSTGTSAGSIVSPGFSFASNNTFGINPNLANPVIPGAPNCGSSSNVPACMATVIANFTPTNTAAQSYGYQRPSSTPVKDTLFPQWLCSVNNFPAGLVTMGCVQ